MWRALGLPIMRRQLRMRLLDWRSYATLGAVVALLFAVEGTSMARGFGPPDGGLSASVQLADRVLLALLVLASAVAACLTSGIVSTERWSGTWHELILMPVPITAILAAKLVECLLFLGLLLCCALPAVVVACLYGDLAPTDLFAAVLVVAATILAVSGTGLLISSVVAHPALARSWTLLVAALWLLAPVAATDAWRLLNPGDHVAGLHSLGRIWLDPISALDLASPGRWVASADAAAPTLAATAWLPFCLVCLAVFAGTFAASVAILRSGTRPARPLPAWVAGYR